MGGGDRGLTLTPRLLEQAGYHILDGDCVPCSAGEVCTCAGTSVSDGSGACVEPTFFDRRAAAPDYPSSHTFPGTYATRTLVVKAGYQAGDVSFSVAGGTISGSYNYCGGVLAPNGKVSSGNMFHHKKMAFHRAFAVKVATKRLPVFLFSGPLKGCKDHKTHHFEKGGTNQIRKTGKREVVLLQPSPETLYRVLALIKFTQGP